MKPGLAAVASLLLIWSFEANAAKNASISGNNVELHGAPSKSSDVLAQLNEGDPVEISNLPTEDYYKVRTAAGQIGWVSADSLSLEEVAAPTPDTEEQPPPAGKEELPAPKADEEIPAPASDLSAPVAAATELPPPAADEMPAAPNFNKPTVSARQEPVPAPVAPVAAPTPTPTATPTPVEPEYLYEDAQDDESLKEQHRKIEKEQRKQAETPAEKPKVAVETSEAKHPFEVKVFLGVQKVALNEVTQLIGYSPMSSATYFGAQLSYPLPVDRLRVLLRAEAMKKSATTSGVDYDLSSIPVMAGISYALLESESGPSSWSLQGSLLAGGAFSTSLQATSTAGSTTNTFQLESTTFTELVKLDFNVPVGDVVAFFVEGGYRFLKTDSVPAFSGGTATTTPLDLSGPFIGGGFQVVF